MSADVEALLIAARNSGGNWTADMIDQAQALIRQDDLADEIEIAARRLDVWAEAGPRSCRGTWYMFEHRHSEGEYAVEKIGPIGRKRSGARYVPAPTAALFLLLLGLPEVAVTCPDCLARGAGGKLARWEWCHRLAFDWYNPPRRNGSPAGPILGSAHYVPAAEQRCAIVVSLMAQGWTVAWTAKRTSGFDIVASRPCPTCTVDGEPTGKVMREPARLLLDAMPVEATLPSRGLDVQTRDVEPPPGVTLGPGQRWVQDVHTRAQGLAFPIDLASPGDPVARERLAVLADELQASGNPRGEWLALWLRGAVETEAGHTMPIDTALPAIAAELRGLQ